MADNALGLALPKGEQENGLRVGVQLAKLALEVDAEHESGVKAVGAGVGGLASGRGVVADSAAF